MGITMTYDTRERAKLAFDVTTTPPTNTADVGGVNAFWVGTAGDAPTTTGFTGYIEDLRVTKGLARYTTNFTTPTPELLG